MLKYLVILALSWAFLGSVQSQNGLSFGNSSYEQIGHNWQIGVGGGLVKFSDKDVVFIGDKHLVQVPRFNATKRINSVLSVDAAISFGSFDTSTKLIAKNNVPYFSFDVSARYRYISTLEKFDPFIFVGGSIVDSNPSRKTTPTFNIGTGITYWFTKMFGFSSQVYYKHSLKSFESMRSHLQFTAGIVFGLNLSSNGRRGSTSCYYNQHGRRRR